VEAQTANAARVARHRERRREGLVVVPTAIDEIATVEFLIDTRFLQPCDRDDRTAVGKALGCLIDKIVKEKL
jgi:hypothetical protein